MDAVEVVALRTGANKQRPGGPALETTWDIKLLLNWVDSLGKNASLSFPVLRQKVICLLRTDLFARTSDLLRLYRDGIKWKGTSCFIRFWRPKEWKPGARGTFRQWTRWLKVEKLKRAKNTCTFRMVRQNGQ